MLSDEEILAQVLAVFQEEQAEHRQAIGEILLELERSPEHPERRTLLDRLFREAHSLKGGARAAGQVAVEQLAHQLEDLFSAVRQGQLALTPEVCDPVYASLEAIGELMARVAGGGQADLSPYALLLTTLQQLTGAAQAVEAAAQAAPLEPAPAGQLAAGSTQRRRRAAAREPRAGNDDADGSANGNGKAALLPEQAEASIRLSTQVLDTLLNETGELITCNLRSRQRSRDAQVLFERVQRWRRVWRQVRPAYGSLRERVAVIQPSVHYLTDRANAPARVAEGAIADRETLLLLDALAQANDLIGELEQALGRHSRLVAEDSARLGSVSDRLQVQVRRTRMLPITTLFGQIRLQVRDMARAAGKEVLLELDDGGAEADRQVLDGLREVLMHLLRNAVDHGIEPPEQRVAAGKPGAGRLALQASVSGDRLVLSLADDGAGLDLQAIKQRALAGGFASAAELERMEQTELVELIFQPGFSTRTSVSTLSGRGVGLDVVRSRVERMHGRVAVQSLSGQGCHFNISVPLSLATSQGLLLRVGAATYALPLDALQHILDVRPAELQLVEGRAVLPLHGRPVPVVPLAGLLNGTQEPMQGRRQALLLGSGERQVACLVDEVLGEQELVVHRLPAPLKQVRFVAGATILPDGRVVPLLDVIDLLRAALGTRLLLQSSGESQQQRRRRRVLVVDDSITTRTLERNILEAAGFVVQQASDGLEALATLSQMLDDGGCDLLLVDVDMPRMNGFELTARIRSEPALKHLPVVLVTSLDAPADRERGIAAGADAYLVKQQFDQQALLDTIALHLTED